MSRNKNTNHKTSRYAGSPAARSPYAGSPAARSPYAGSPAGRQNYEAGVAAILSVLILTMILTVSLGASTILVRELRFSRESNFYVRAFFAADSGIEKILTLRDAPQSFTDCTSSLSPCVLANGAEYWVVVTATGAVKPDGSPCTAGSFCIKSIGRYMGTRRAIEVNY